ncbi:MAG: AAA family ATPase, partial [Cypionkella sp.]|nr:AAA family ATPase [Cypionkella sp.]
MNLPKPIPFTPQAGASPLIYDFQAWQEIDPAQIPRLRFVYGDTFAAGYLSVTFAAPKTGKSLLALSEAIDAATGRGFLTGKPAAPIKVLYYNAEDDLAVIQGRVAAVLQAWQIPQSEIIGRLFPVSGVTAESPVVLIRGEKGDIAESAFLALADLIKREGIALAIFDPLQDLSHSPETNEVFRALGGRIRALASETGAAIGLVHHTRKPSPGIAPTLDDGRGGSALRGVARFNRLLVPMTEAEGAQAGVDDFRHYFRIGEAESNLAPPSSDRN